MDQRERYYDAIEPIRLAMEANQADLWTALPCVVQAFPSASGLSKMMLDAQPTISASMLNVSGEQVSVQFPLLINVPILWQGGGGMTMTFPIAVNDECLVIFSSRCIDAWWQNGAGPLSAPGLPPPRNRMHNLSDGFALVGVRSLPREFAVDATRMQLRSDSGQVAISINPSTQNITVATTTGEVDVTSTNGQIKATAPNINLNGVTIDSNGNIVTPGNINSSKIITATTDVVGGGKSLKTHLTTGVQPGGGISGPPQ